MTNFIKKGIEGFSFTAAVLIIGSGLLSSCASNNNSNSANSNSIGQAEYGEADKTDKNTAPGKPMEKKPAENKPTASNAAEKPSDTNYQPEIKEFSDAKGAGTGELGSYAKWNFTDGADSFEITSDGRGKRTGGEDRVTEFRLSLEKQDALDNQMYFTRYKGDLIVLYGVTAGEDSGSVIVRLDNASLKPKWTANINTFNATKGLVENQTAYLGAMGFAAKIDLETGKYLWKQDDFYRKYNKDGAFNVMETPELKGDTITYTEKRRDGGINSIIFDKTSGKVIKVNVQ